MSLLMFVIYNVLIRDISNESRNMYISHNKEIQYVMKSIRNHSTILSQPCLQSRTFVTFHRYYQKEFIPKYCICKLYRF